MRRVESARNLHKWDVGPRAPRRWTRFLLTLLTILVLGILALKYLTDRTPSPTPKKARAAASTSQPPVEPVESVEPVEPVEPQLKDEAQGSRFGFGFGSFKYEGRKAAEVSPTDQEKDTARGGATAASDAQDLSNVIKNAFANLGRELGNLEPLASKEAPRAPPLQRKPGLLAVPVGERSKDSIAPVLDRFRTEGFTVVLFHYDASDWSAFPHYAEYVSVRAVGQTKYWFAKRFLTPDVVSAYEYLFLWDDDVGLAGDWSPAQFAGVLKRVHAHAAQPALLAGTRANPQLDVVRVHQDPAHPIGRWTNFVEIMFPVYSVSAWAHCVWPAITYDGISFWGADNAFYPVCAAAGYCRFAVIDAMPVQHLDAHRLVQDGAKNMRELTAYGDLLRNECKGDVPHPPEPNAAIHIQFNRTGLTGGLPHEHQRQLLCSYMKTYQFGLAFYNLRGIAAEDARAGTCPDATVWPGVLSAPWWGHGPAPAGVDKDTALGLRSDKGGSQSGSESAEEPEHHHQDHHHAKPKQRHHKNKKPAAPKRPHGRVHPHAPGGGH